MQKVSLILLTYNNFKLTNTRLKEIFSYLHSTKYLLEVILVDNGSTDNSLDRILSIYGNLISKVVRIKDNVGFGGGFNIGFSHAEGDIIICLSNDVVMKGNFVDKLLSLFEVSDKILVGGKIINFPGGWNEFGNKFVPYAEGWMVAATKEGWKELGYWDERYYPSDCEDIDLSITAYKLGYQVLGFSDRFSHYIAHIGSGTIKDSGRMDRTKINRQKLLDKWSDQIESILG